MLEADYLIVGSGAVGMAFADVLVQESDATMIIVDRYAKPGGHWNVAYPFVTLHQPSAFYGVSSKELSTGKKDEIGLNKGLMNLASGPEISAYFDDVMQKQFLPSGRVQYFPMCNYKGNHQFESMLTGETFEVKVNKKLVDATFLNTSVPSTHTPNFSIDPEVPFMPLNDLPKIKEAPEGFVVIGGGKTGIDACLWLLQNQVNPDQITWIVSRDAWLLDRANVQPSAEFFEQTIGTQAAQFEAIAQAENREDLFDRLEAAGVFLRIDKSVRPQMFHGATISKPEMEQLQRIKNTIRMGRVQRIEKDQIVLDRGTLPTNTKTIHVDCSATPIRSDLGTKPVFQGDVITPQTVRPYQPLFSSAFIAHIETTWKKESEKNVICKPVRLPNHTTDWIPMTLAAMENQFVWSQKKKLGPWLYNNRLDGFSKMVKDTPKDDEKKQAIIRRMREASMPALTNLLKFNKEIESKDQPELKNPQFQVQKNLFLKGKMEELPASEFEVGEGEVLVKIDQFAYTANNITYAAAGDMLGYWQFFPPAGENSKGWGVIPVWGFADVVESNSDEIPVGDRLFGYFPPASHVKMTPSKVSKQQFVEGSAHRKHLPQGYNLYSRVLNEPSYNKAFDSDRALLYPLYLTSYCIWDAVQDANYHDAEQVLILSASSKTSIGTAYAFEADANAPKMIGMTSARNVEMVKGLNLYQETLSYDELDRIDTSKATVIIDMSGNGRLMGKLHQLLGDSMKHTIFVGLTHWSNAKQSAGINQDRSTRFFVPMHAQQRAKEWGFAEFNSRINQFVLEAGTKTRKWLKFKTVDGLQGLEDIHVKVCTGQADAREGLIVQM